MLTIILIWFALSLPLGIFIGKFIKAGQARQYDEP